MCRSRRFGVKALGGRVVRGPVGGFSQPRYSKSQGRSLRPPPPPHHFLRTKAPGKVSFSDIREILILWRKKHEDMS